jgi:uncharacterized protein HemX
MTMGITTKILAALVLGLGLISGLQTLRVHGLKAEAAETHARHAQALAAALDRQAADLSAQTLAERQAREARERQIAGLTARLKQMEDYYARLAPVLHAYLDGLLDRAGQPAGLVPAGSGPPARARIATGRAPATGAEQR